MVIRYCYHGYQVEGGVVVSLGAWLRFDDAFRSFVDVTDSFNFIFSIAYLITSGGVVIVAISVLGLCAAQRKDRIILITVSSRFCHTLNKTSSCNFVLHFKT